MNIHVPLVSFSLTRVIVRVLTVLTVLTHRHLSTKQVDVGTQNWKLRTNMGMQQFFPIYSTQFSPKTNNLRLQEWLEIDAVASLISFLWAREIWHPLPHYHIFGPSNFFKKHQWKFQEPKLEVSAMYKAYVRRMFLQFSRSWHSAATVQSTEEAKRHWTWWLRWLFSGY